MDEEPKVVAHKSNEHTAYKDLERKSIKVKVLFFAKARDLAGLSEKILLMEEGSTTSDCIERIVSEVPSLKSLLNCMIAALNEEYVIEPTIMKDGDDLALIPPISGG